MAVLQAVEMEAFFELVDKFAAKLLRAHFGEKLLYFLMCILMVFCTSGRDTPWNASGESIAIWSNARNVVTEGVQCPGMHYGSCRRCC